MLGHTRFVVTAEIPILLAIAPALLNVALYVLLAMVAVSVYATFDIQFSLGKVSGVLLGVLLYWAIVRWVTTRERLRFATA